MEQQKRKPRLLLVCCRPEDAKKDSPLPEHQEWFEAAMELEPGQIETIYAADQNYPDLLNYDGVVVGGSIHSVYEDLPWIPALEDFIRNVFQINKPYLGVCFGHQIAIKALGGKVSKGTSGPEVGRTPVQLTKEGKYDKLFYDLPEEFDVAQFHGDAVTDLPESEDIKALVINEKYDTQAFAYGEFARTVQFHPEFNPPIINRILDRHKKDLFADGWFSSEEELQSTRNLLLNDQFHKNGQRIAKNFYNHFILEQLSTQ